MQLYALRFGMMKSWAWWPDTQKNLSGHMAYIALVGAVERAQRHGIAGKLIKCFCVKCKSKGIDKLHLHTDTGNSAAIQMYEKLGFQELIIENELRPKDDHFYACINNILKD